MAVLLCGLKNCRIAKAIITKSISAAFFVEALPVLTKDMSDFQLINSKAIKIKSLTYKRGIK
jgi:hypothetical protein